jgi:hypothetical protein
VLCADNPIGKRRMNAAITKPMIEGTSKFAMGVRCCSQGLLQSQRACRFAATWTKPSCEIDIAYRFQDCRA